MAPWLLLPRILLFLSTLRPRDIDGSEGRLWVLVFAHDRYCHAGNCIGLPSNTGLFLSTANIHLFLFQHHLITCDSWPLLLIQFSSVWRQSFEIEVSDLYFSSPWFSTVDTWDPISSDESPCRTIPVQFWVSQTHVSQFVQTFQNIIGWNFCHR